MHSSRHPLVRYAVAVLSVAVAFFIRYACDGWLQDRSALDFFLAATAVSAWSGGAGPAGLSILLSTILGLWFFVSPRHTIFITDVVDLLETGSFIFAGSAIAYLTCAMKRRQEELAREVEERRRIERELQVLNTRLEERVDERTGDLRRALQELEAYAYSIAHNLRGPLRGMAGLSDILMDDERHNLSFEGQAHLRRIMESARRMDELIMGLLDYSRVSREDVPRLRVPLGEVVDEAIRRRGEDLRRRRADIAVDGPLPDVTGHREALVQVVAHLLSNAAKFVAPGIDPQIRVRAERTGAVIRLWIEDNGIGIDPRYHDRVFGVFERLHKQEEYPGTGIGLAIVRKCMERMGGHASVQSEPGKGSRFWIEAPAA